MAGKHTPFEAPACAGPYWLHHTDSELQILGRYGAILYRYLHTQEDMAEAHLRRLQRRHQRDLRAMRDATPELLEALTATRRELWHCARQLAARGLARSPGDSVDRALAAADAALTRARGPACHGVDPEPAEVVG